MADPITISATIASWFTPSSLFILLNLVIATIVISSRFAAPSDHHHHGGDGHHPHLLRRSSSLLDRFRSLHFYRNDAAFPETTTHHNHLVRTPSLVDRVRSFNFGFYNHVPEPAGPETEHARPGDPVENLTEPGMVRTPSLVERVRSFKNFGFYNGVSEPAGPETEEARPDDPVQNPAEPEMVRTPSFLERLRSVNLSSIYRSESMKRGGEKVEGECDEGGLVRRSKSERGKGTAEMSPEKMKKSESEKLTRGGGNETASFWEEDETVDAKADDFINRFKQQLRLQRLNSFLRYGEMVAAN